MVATLPSRCLVVENSGEHSCMIQIKYDIHFNFEDQKSLCRMSLYK